MKTNRKIGLLSIVLITILSISIATKLIADPPDPAALCKQWCEPMQYQECVLWYGEPGHIYKITCYDRVWP